MLFGTRLFSDERYHKKLPKQKISFFKQKKENETRISIHKHKENLVLPSLSPLHVSSTERNPENKKITKNKNRKSKFEHRAFP